MTTVEVCCPSCGDWRDEDVSEEEITSRTMNGNPIMRCCAKCASHPDDGGRAAARERLSKSRFDGRLV